MLRAAFDYNMPSYLRNVFGSSFLAPHSSSSSDNSSKKSHVRSHSAPQNLLQGRNLDYIYAKATSTVGESPSQTADYGLNSTTTRPTTPSPLRYATYDSSVQSTQASTFRTQSTPSLSKSSSQGLMERRTSPRVLYLLYLLTFLIKHLLTLTISLRVLSAARIRHRLLSILKH